MQLTAFLLAPPGPKLATLHPLLSVWTVDQGYRVLANVYSQRARLRIRTRTSTVPQSAFLILRLVSIMTNYSFLHFNPPYISITYFCASAFHPHFEYNLCPICKPLAHQYGRDILRCVALMSA
jgi:hypothetical protein